MADLMAMWMVHSLQALADKALEPIRSLANAWSLTGSRVMCSPPPMDTDLDVVVLVPCGWDEEAVTKLVCAGWWTTGDQYGDSDFRSVKGFVDGTLVNLLVTDDPVFYRATVQTTEIVAQMNPLDKAARIVLFDTIHKYYRGLLGNTIFTEAAP